MCLVPMTEELLESTVSLTTSEVMGSNLNPESTYLYWNVFSENLSKCFGANLAFHLIGTGGSVHESAT